MTNTHPTFDPELAALLPGLKDFTPVGMTLERLPYFRGISATPRAMILGDAPVTCVDYTIPGYQGADIIVSVVRRRDHAKPGPGIYCMHGGGMVMGSRFAGTHPMVRWALEHDAVCMTVDYRLAPEFPAPIPSEDCYAGLLWMAANAAMLGFDASRLVVFGAAAAVVQRQPSR